MADVYADIKNLKPGEAPTKELTLEETGAKTAQEAADKGFVLSKSTLPGGISYSGVSENKITDSTSDIRDDINSTNDDLNKTAAELAAESEAYANKLSEDEQRSIEQAGAEAGAGYDPLIRQAQESEKAGMGKAEVAAGEAGGFMSTQWAGVGAIMPTVGGTREGTGGQLAQMRSEYRAQIQSLEAAKSNAINAARAAQKKALVTGKRADYKDAQEKLQSAREFALKQREATDAHTKAVNDAIKANFEAKKEQADYMAKNIAPALSEELAANPANSKEIMDKYLAMGYDPVVLTSAMVSYQAEKASADLVNSSKTIDILSKTYEGGTVDVPGMGKVTVLGTEADKPTVLDTSKGMMAWVVDPKTGEGKYEFLKDENGKIMTSLAYEKANAPKKTGTGTVKLDAEQKKLQTIITAELKKLAKGGDWGASWNYVKNLYPDIPNEILDEALRKDQFYPKEEPKKEPGAISKAVGKAIDWIEFWK